MGEEHAVPQDITGFKFKLIGDMTVKQFGELAFGAICAYIFYASGIYPIIKWPLAVFFALFGVALAFLPISERPLDIWIINFFRAIYRPTYYVWKKDFAARTVSEADFMPGYTPLASTEVTRSQPAVTLQQSAATQTASWPFSLEKKPETATAEPKKTTDQSVTALIEKPAKTPTEKSRILSVDELIKQRQEATSTPTPLPPPTPAVKSTEEAVAVLPPKVEESGQPTPFTVDQLVILRQQKQTTNDQNTTRILNDGERQISELANQVKELMIQIDEIKNKISANNNGESQEAMAKKLTDLLERRGQAAEKLSQLRKQVSDTRVLAVAVPEYKEPIKSPTKVRIVPKTSPQQPAAIRLTDLPNVINGMVTDTADKPLENVILVIKDQSGNSIRAFKTNKIGQFIVSTPMQDGTYILELEKNGFNFDTLEVTLSGQVLAPLTIKANSALQGQQIQP